MVMSGGLHCGPLQFFVYLGTAHTFDEWKKHKNYQNAIELQFIVLSA